MASQNIKILLADDDKDDCMFFKEALEELQLEATLNVVHDGEQLMLLLTKCVTLENSDQLPHVLFLDLNMPRKNGFTCLEQIKQHEKLKHIPVIIFSTSYNEKNANTLYNSGAHYYISKPSDFPEFKSVIQLVVALLAESPMLQPLREKFVLNT